MAAKSIQKFITFSPELYRLVSSRASRYGMSVAEYVRHLVVTDTKEERGDIPMVDAETEKNIAASLKEIKEGRHTELKSHKEIDEYFAKLDKEALGD